MTDFELNYNEFMLRTYDPQVGRWTGADPFDEFASPYIGMGNDPISNVDPTGGAIGPILNGILNLIFGGGFSGAGGAALTTGLTTLTAFTTAASSFAVAGSIEFGKSINSIAGNFSGSSNGGNGGSGFNISLSLSGSTNSINEALLLNAGNDPTPLPQWVCISISCARI